MLSVRWVRLLYYYFFWLKGLFFEVFAESGYQSVRLKFRIVNKVTFYRWWTFAFKEPEVFEWINQLPQGTVLWDIGANIGVFTLYAAKKSNIARVIAFEPESANVSLLVDNLLVNDASNVEVVPLALFEESGIATYYRSDCPIGGAESSFGLDVNEIGDVGSNRSRFQLFGISPSDAVGLGIQPPSAIKIDVDGIEPVILESLKPILGGVRHLCVEINTHNNQQTNEIAEILIQSGFICEGDRQSDFLRKGKTERIRGSFNQFWIRN